MIDEVFLLQRMNGKHVVVENPTTSDLWQQPEIRRWSEDEFHPQVFLLTCAPTG